MGNPIRPEVIALAGATIVAVGTYVPWVVPAPGVELVPAIYLQGMGWRVAGSDYLVLAVLLVGLATAATRRRRRHGGYLLAGTGAVVAALTALVTATSIDGFVGTFVPGVGAFLTVVGGLVLVGAGWHHLETLDGRRDTPVERGRPATER